MWNADGTGQPIVLRGHTELIESVAFRPDGGRIASASDEDTLRLWNADGTGQPGLLSSHIDAVTAVAFFFDGRRIVSGSSDKTLRVWSDDEPLGAAALSSCGEPS
jgi:WD40 repeat protein